MDLALALVQDDHGAAAALEVARWLVLFLQRPGGQSQFSTRLQGQLAQRAPLRDLQSWIPDHLRDDLSVTALARRAGMSGRNFSRAFRREVGSTPATYVEKVRVEAARQALEADHRGMKGIADTCGFGTVETLERSFRRTMGVAPRDYRHRFQPPPQSCGRRP